MTSVYRPILKQALKITWRYKFLWFFGLFAALLGNGGEYNLLVNNLSRIEDQGSLLANLKFLYQSKSLGFSWQSIELFFENFNFSSLMILLFLLALLGFLIWLAIVSQAGLIWGVFQINKKTPSSFLENLKKGKENFWLVLGLNVISKVVIYLFLMVLSLPLLLLFLATQENLIWQALLILLSFIILIPIAIIVSFIIKFAIIYLVVKKESFRQALKSGWQLFTQNWIVSLEMAFILFFINIIAGFILGFILLPFVIFGLFLYYTAPSAFLWLTFLFALILFIVIIFLFGAVLACFQISSWVLLFTRLTEGEVFSKLVRVIATLPQHFKKSKSVE